MRSMLNILALCICLAGAAALAGCDNEESMATPPPAKVEEKAVRVEVLPIQPVMLQDVLILPGETEPDKDVCVSAENAGKVTWLGVEEGDWVTQGCVIARQDVAAVDARLLQAQAAEKLASEQLRRRQQLLEEGVLAKEEFDRMAAELDQSKASVQEIKVNKDYGEVRAPISGVVNTRSVDCGEYMSSGDQLVEIVDPSVMRININVPEMDIPHVSKGQKVNVSVDALPGRTWKGVVDFVSFKADATSKTFKVRVLTDNGDGAIRAGMLARVTLRLKVIENAVAVPLHAIINQGGERLLFVEQDGLARARTVTLGIIEGERAQVLSGLEPGERLIVTGHTMVEDGTKVAVQ